VNIIAIVIIVFIVLEATGLLELYLVPSSKYAHSLGVLDAGEWSQHDPGSLRLLKYLVNSVAGAKLILILLLVVILFMADQQTLVVTGARDGKQIILMHGFPDASTRWAEPAGVLDGGT
jgi:hypothetical protein